MHRYVQCDPHPPPPPPKPQGGRRQRQRKRAHELLEQQAYAQPGHPGQPGPQRLKKAKTQPLTPPDKTLSNFYNTPGGARPRSAYVAVPKDQFGSLTAHEISQIYRPRPPAGTQYPIRLQPDAQGTTDTLENFLITGKLSTDDTREETVLLLLTASTNGRAGPTTAAVRDLLRKQIAVTYPQSAHHNMADSIDITPVTKETKYYILDGLPSTSSDARLSPIIQKSTHAWLLTARSGSPAAETLLFLTSRQVDWAPSLGPIATNTGLSESDVKLLRSQPVQLHRARKAPPSRTAEAATLTSPVFKGKCPDTALRYFQEALLYTLQEALNDPSDKQQNAQATSMETLSQTVQALLQKADAMQPASEITSDAAGTISFHPAAVDTLFLSQSKAFSLDLRHPQFPHTEDVYTYKPPRLPNKAGLRQSDRFNRRKKLVQSTDALFVRPPGHDGQLSDHWLLEGLTEGLHSGLQFMEERMGALPVDDDQIESLLQLDIAPDLSVIQSHPRREPKTTMKTSIVITPQDPRTYAILATQQETVSVSHATKTQWRGNSEFQISHLRFNPDRSSLLGKQYFPLLLSPDLHQKFPHLRPLGFNEKRGDLSGPRADKIQWTLALLEHEDLLDEFDAQQRQKQTETQPQTLSPQ